MMKKRRTTQTIRQTLAVALAAFLGVQAGVMQPIATSAEEEVVKNFSYFAALSDYEVYVEYCEAFNSIWSHRQLTISDTLPAEEDLPFDTFDSTYGQYHYYNNPYVTFDVILNENYPEVYDYYYTVFYSGAPLEEQLKIMQFLGFENIVEDPETTDPIYATMSESGVEEVYIEIYTKPLYESETMDKIDFYRLYLTVYNSELFQTYGKTILPAAYYGFIVLGDADNDGTADAEDAALVLQYASAYGSGVETSEDTIHVNLADINEDGVTDAEDAAQILIVAAEEGVK